MVLVQGTSNWDAYLVLRVPSTSASAPEYKYQYNVLRVDYSEYMTCMTNSTLYSSMTDDYEYVVLRVRSTRYQYFYSYDIDNSQFTQWRCGEWGMQVCLTQCRRDM